LLDRGARRFLLQRGRHEIELADREIEQDFILLRTLSTFPSYVDQDWPNFYAQAKAALQGRAYVIVLDDSFRQLVNTYVPYGEQPAKTGDPETALRIIRTKQPDVSDLFISRVTKTPVFNVDLPTLTNGEVRHILNLGHTAESLLRIVHRRTISDWPVADEAARVRLTGEQR